MSDKKKTNPAGGPGSGELFCLGGQFELITNHCRYPESGSIRATVLFELLAGAEITGLDAWRDIGTSRLAAHIHALRQFGWPILSRSILVTGKHGKPSRVASYRLALPLGSKHQ